MAYTDWVFDQVASPDLQAVLATAGTNPADPPPVGNAWLHLRQTAAGQAGWGTLTRDQDLVTVPNYVPGLLRGKMRTLVRLRNSNVGFGVLDGGMACMQSARDICVVGASAYILAMHVTVGGALTLQLQKWTDGFRAAETPAVLASSTSIPGAALALGVTKAIELEWDVNLAQLGGVLLTARAGDATDFSTLADVPGCVALDYLAPLVTSTWEGLVGGDIQMVSDVFFDETYIYGE